MNKHIPKKIGSLHPNIAPYGETFQCQDGKWIVLAVGSDQQFAKLAVLLELPELPKHPRFSTNSARVQHRQDLASTIKAEFLKKPFQEWKVLLLEQHIPFGEIKDLQGVFDEEQAKELILEQETEGLATKRVKTVAFQNHGIILNHELNPSR